MEGGTSCTRDGCRESMYKMDGHIMNQTDGGTPCTKWMEALHVPNGGKNTVYQTTEAHQQHVNIHNIKKNTKFSFICTVGWLKVPLFQDAQTHTV